MKCIYWRPQKVSPRVLLMIAAVAVAGLAVVEWSRSLQSPSQRRLQRSASQLAANAIEAIRAERLRRGHEFNERFDPGGTGLIGEAMSPVTSLPADLEAKQTSVNPNFAAAVVEMLTQAGVGRDDVVAVGYSGSFPALNLCVCAALETIGARPLIIASTASSQFGANRPDLLWIDMERLLYRQQLISFHSAAATLGGYGDRGVGMSPESLQAFQAAIARNDLELIEPTSLDEAIEQRVAFYQRHASGPIKAYINVGGGAASVRGAVGKKAYSPGLTLRASPDEMSVDCVLTRFARQGIPVIHLSDAKALARRYGLPEAPATLPAVSPAGVSSGRHNRWLAAAVLAAILLILRSFVLTGFGYRLTTWLRRCLGLRESASESPAPQWMV